MTALKGNMAVVTGASRGIGKGIALALGEAGATVYLTGRTVGDGERTIDTTARLVTEKGGQSYHFSCSMAPARPVSTGSRPTWPSSWSPRA